MCRKIRCDGYCANFFWVLRTKHALNKKNRRELRGKHALLPAAGVLSGRHRSGVPVSSMGDAVCSRLPRLASPDAGGRSGGPPRHAQRHCPAARLHACDCARHCASKTGGAGRRASVPLAARAICLQLPYASKLPRCRPGASTHRTSAPAPCDTSAMGRGFRVELHCNHAGTRHAKVAHACDGRGGLGTVDSQATGLCEEGTLPLLYGTCMHRDDYMHVKRKGSFIARYGRASYSMFFPQGVLIVVARPARSNDLKIGGSSIG